MTSQDRFPTRPNTPQRYNYCMLKPTEKIWHNGRFIDWNDAKIHVLSHVASYGSSVFEGIRCYTTPFGTGHFPGTRPYPPPAGFRQDLSHRGEIHGRPARRGDDRAGSLESFGLVLFAAPGIARLWRRWSSALQQSHRNVHRLLGMGKVSRAKKRSPRASTSAFPVGPGSPPTRYRRWPRRAPIT